MKQIINPEKHKVIVVFVAMCATFFGLEAASLSLSLYEIPNFIQISFYIYFFLVIWQTVVFDLHLGSASSLPKAERLIKRSLRERFRYLAQPSHWLHFQNYLLLPGIIYWATVTLLYLNPFDVVVKQVWIILSTIFLGISYWYLKSVFYAHKSTPHRNRQPIFLTKLFATFLSFAASFGVARYFDYPADWFFFMVFALSFLLLYQALFQHHFVNFRMLGFLLGTGIFLGGLGLVVYYFWNVNFYSGALVLAAVYNAIWGFIHHKFIERNFNRRVFLEYLAILVLVLVIILSTTNFAERI